MRLEFFFSGLSYGAKCDVWSLGIILMELCDGHPPFFNFSPLKAVMKITTEGIPPLKHPKLFYLLLVINYYLYRFSNELVDFLQKCLQVDTEKRADSFSLMKHDFLCTLQSEQENERDFAKVVNASMAIVITSEDSSGSVGSAC